MEDQYFQKSELNMEETIAILLEFSANMNILEKNSENSFALVL